MAGPTLFLCDIGFAAQFSVYSFMLLRVTRATMKVHHLFSAGVPQDTTRVVRNTGVRFFRRFWVRDPVIQETFRTKSATSIVARVGRGCSCWIS